MAENWAAIKTLWQDGIWHDVFSPSLSMVQAYIKIKTKPMCILHNVTANVWNKVRVKNENGLTLSTQTFEVKEMQHKEGIFIKNHLSSYKTTRKTYSLASVFSILFKKNAQSKGIFPLFEPSSWSRLGAADFWKKLQHMCYARSYLSTVIHINLWSFKYCGIKVFTVLDINLC